MNPIGGNHAPRSTALVAALLAGVSACTQSVNAERVPGISGADALWAGGGAFCVRAPNGLSCWDTGERELVRNAPTVVAGVDGVQEVAMRIGEGCALHAKGVSCFRAGEAAAKPMPFESPAQIVATAGYPGLICVLDAKGVSCWGGETRSPKLRPELGRPKRLLVSVNGGTLCGIGDDGVRCFEIKTSGELGAGVLLRDVSDPKHVMLNTIGGRVLVVDGGVARSGVFSGSVTVGNPFAVKNPLDTEVSIRPFTGATTTPTPISGVGPVKTLAHRSIWPLVLDADGIAELDGRSSGFEIKRWPTNGVPQGLWSGKDVFYTLDGGVLHERGGSRAKPTVRRVDRVMNPTSVVASLYFTCTLEAAGTVACVPSKQT